MKLCDLGLFYTLICHIYVKKCNNCTPILPHCKPMGKKLGGDINRFPTADITELELHSLSWAGLSELQEGKYLFSPLLLESLR